MSTVVVLVAQQVLAQPAEVNEVINRAQLFVGGIALGLAGLGYSIAGVRLMFGGDDPAQVGQAKEAIKNVSKGLAVVLAFQLLIAIVQFIAAGTG
jgi:hypothetical protein